ncbi:hypothetical protein COV93_01735 [Candidatus Woesearchaeota archaeon CG11_big_fil_rev_8_21_14_0_20_43_8]|nr:MAG: hypothetical protein COV93_01735 [Candidatus Woesearchaeota archaeon CG11_big_fil_rev_8_21_14_0_20_43_8]PIO05110.1 MAG: hypothetical protein COT47_06230 [Candidatus Woesearchaeota archaeon CG08_land_8_20_14_0_20_43_7]
MAFPLFTLNELMDIIIMVAFLGFIFKDVFKAPMYEAPDDPEFYLKTYNGGFDWHGFKFAVLVTAPAVLFHELGHKFVAMAFGMVAQFKAAYIWLALGAILKLAGVGFIFVVPAYVSWGCSSTDASCMALLQSSPWVGALIAVAGPAVNLLIWLLIAYLLKEEKIPSKYVALAVLTKNINKFLFIFNMIPIPGFDGFHFFSRLLAMV